MTTIYLALGSNLGDREEYLRQARAKLAPEIIVGKISPVYEAEPMYNTVQPTFLNAVCEAATALSSEEVLAKIQGIEREMGEHVHNQPRIIDIDLLFYGSLTAVFPRLTVPHPKIAERAFVLAPMADIAPDFVHPVLGVTIAELLAQLGDFSKQVWRTHVQL